MARILALTRRCPATWLGKHTAYALKKPGIRALDGVPVDIEALGIRFRLNHRDNTCERRLLFTPQFFDPDERALLLSRVKPGFIFVDVGANAGAYALTIALAAAGTGRTLAIEAHPEMFRRLATNVAFNAVLGVEPVHCAVADREGEIVIHWHSRNLGETSIKNQSQTIEKKTSIVQARRLASIVVEKKLPRIDAMKLDIEGAEDVVLGAFFRDAEERLWPEMILTETHQYRWSCDVTGMLVEKGYRKIRQFGGNAAFERIAG